MTLDCIDYIDSIDYIYDVDYYCPLIIFVGCMDSVLLSCLYCYILVVLIRLHILYWFRIFKFLLIISLVVTITGWIKDFSRAISFFKNDSSLENYFSKKGLLTLVLNSGNL